jgi:hypothetical protein
MGVNHGGLHVLLAEEFLHRPDIVTAPSVFLLQHRHGRIVRLGFAGFVDGDDAVLPFLAAFLDW